MIARTETLAAMRQLDGKRNSILVQFLQDAHLIGFNSGNIVSFQNADLSSTDLNNTDLNNANLSGADLSNADFSNADLSSALYLTQQQLDQVYTCKGAISPKGLTCN